MKATFLILTMMSTILFSSNLFANEEWEVFNCLPVSGKPNGFGIKTMKLKVSTEHPEAHYTLVRKNQSVQKGIMDYEGSDIQFTINDDEYTINVKRVKKGLWTATLTHDSMDTISQLSCKKE